MNHSNTTATITELTIALEKGFYYGWELVSAKYIDSKTHDYELYAVTFGNRKTAKHKRLFFDRVRGIAWPLAVANAKCLISEGR